MRTNQTAECFEHPLTQNLRVKYLLFLPRDYASDLPRKWPLLLFLHGSGERGHQLAKVAAHGPPRIVKSTPDFPFIVVSPQCPAGEFWNSPTLLLLLDDLEKKYRIDKTRLYLTGLSMGGYGVWDLALAKPERFAAVAPICGGGNLLPILLAERAKNRALRTLGIWAFHGAKDPVVRVEESERMIAAVRSAGNPAKLTIYPDAGHDSWTETYDNPALYKWFMEHRRK